MKSRYMWLALAGLGSLSACTVNYYGTGPEGGSRPPRSGQGSYGYSRHDTVYVTGSTTTVVSQPQPGPGRPPRNGGYAGGPGRSPQPPTTGGGYGQPGGAGTGGSISVPPPRISTPTTGSGGTTQPTVGGSTAGTGSGPAQPPVRTGGIKPSRPVTTIGGTSGGSESSPIRTGGIKPVRPINTGSTSTSAEEPPIRTGGIKPVRPIDNGGTRETQPEPGGNGGTVLVAEPPIRTGGIKPLPGGGIKTGESDVEQPIRTGGIKPARPVDNGGITISPTAEEPPIRMGGIKPVRGNENSGSESDQPIRTGGIKPARPVDGGSISVGGTDAEQPIRTGGIKPVRGAEGELTTAQPMLIFTKPGCRGACPTYTATVWPDGRVLYIGQQNVPQIGTFELALPAATVASMQQQALNVGFMDLQEAYVSGNTDIPASVLTMYAANGQAKTVTVETGAPEQVQQFFNYIDQEMNRLASTSHAGKAAELRKN